MVEFRFWMAHLDGVFSIDTSKIGITNKVRLCERSEPQSEPFVGRARFDQMWTVVVGFGQITLDIG